MNIEDRLRQALTARAGGVEPTDGASLERIQRRGAEATRRQRRQRVVLGALGAAAAVLVAVVAIPALLDDDGEQIDTIADSTTTTEDEAPTTSTSIVPPVEEVSAAVWPFGASTYTDPVELAVDFMRDYIGMPNPVAGDLQQGDARSGEVPVRPRPDFPGFTTTVLVRQLDDSDTWSVIGAAADNIRIDSPTALAPVADPVAVRGESTAFEANVEAEVRQDGQEAGEQLGGGFVMGGSNGEFARFEGTILFSDPTESAGAVILFTSSAEDGSIQEASVVRVRFPAGARQRDLTSEIRRCVTPAAEMASAGEMTVELWFVCSRANSADNRFVAVTRAVPETTGVLRSAIDALIAGSAPADAASGLHTVVPPTENVNVRGVSIDGSGHAVVDFTRFEKPPNSPLETRAGSSYLMEQLNRTVFEFPTVNSVEYRIGGDCSRVLAPEIEPCQVYERDDLG